MPLDDFKIRAAEIQPIKMRLAVGKTVAATADNQQHSQTYDKITITEIIENIKKKEE